MTLVFDPGQLLTDLPNGSVSIFDRELRYVYAAGQGLRDVGLSPEALIGRRLDEVFPADAAALVEPQYRRVFAGESVVFGLHFFHRTYSLSAAPFLSSAGQVEQILVVAQDITSLQASEPSAALAHAENPGDHIMATLGHELRNPLGAIRAAVGVIQRSAERSVREWARTVIERQVATAEALIQDLGELSRVQRATLCLHYSEAPVQAMLSDAVEAVAHLPRDGKPRIRMAASAAEITLRVDRPRVVRVLANLLSNAIRYSPDGGDVILACQLTPDSVSLSVTDSGMGIAPEALGRIFELFQREHAGESDGGLGIGLYISREIAERHGGRIDVFSAGEGQGATFTVRLPRALVVATH